MAPISSINPVPPRGLKEIAFPTLKLSEFRELVNEIMPIIKSGGLLDVVKFETFVYNMGLYGLELERKDVQMMDKLFCDLKKASTDQRFGLNVRIQMLKLLDSYNNRWVDTPSFIMKNDEKTVQTVAVKSDIRNDLAEKKKNVMNTSISVIKEKPVSAKRLLALLKEVNSKENGVTNIERNLKEDKVLTKDIEVEDDMFEKLNNVDEKIRAQIIKIEYLSKIKSLTGKPKHLRPTPVAGEHRNNLNLPDTSLNRTTDAFGSLVNRSREGVERIVNTNASENRNVEIIVCDDVDFIKISCSNYEKCVHVAELIKSHFNTTDYCVWRSKLAMPLLKTKEEICERRRFFTRQVNPSTKYKNTEEEPIKYTKDFLLAIRSQMDMDEINSAKMKRGILMTKSAAA
ncbi:uncharacterized protein LOC119680142 [Teleopsis dalmanni]|uniref:uncharacterized protein LOC119680142 n=1 Tax=Teleopsis dalmanni TaxID=139649 RepID=UPI0018CE100E|nr:uncharacterized protein LOC119680142 [Teleopsis dalmanni]